MKRAIVIESCSPPPLLAGSLERRAKLSAAAAAAQGRLATLRTRFEPVQANDLNSPVSISRSTSASIWCSLVPGSVRRSCQARNRRNFRISSTYTRYRLAATASNSRPAISAPPRGGAGAAPPPRPAGGAAGGGGGGGGPKAPPPPRRRP